MLAAADKKHMAAVAALRKEHQQIMARHTAEHRAGMYNTCKGVLVLRKEAICRYHLVFPW